MNKFLLNISFVLFVNFTLGQGVFLEELSINPNLIKSVSQQQNRSTEFDMYYIIDTISLPFIDDFSSNLQLRYNSRPSSKFVTDSAFAKYRLNGKLFDTLFYKFNPLYNYHYSSITQRVDSLLSDPWILEEYIEDIPYPRMVYPSMQFYFSNGMLVDSTVVLPDDTLINEVYYKYYVRDSTKKWIDNHAFVNNTMSINPPTYGVATLDGIDSIGHPYNFANANAQGIADYLTSYPINLQNKTNVFLSFYYQPQGLGNSPESEDSLVVEFYAPHPIDRWYHAWSVSGSEVHPFKYVSIPVIFDHFLKKGFQFRFKNYATLSGSFDHWHIDYVYLNDNRVVHDSIIPDLAYKEVPQTLLKEYISMPWSHYVLDPDYYMKEELSVKLNNLSSLTLEGRNRYEVIDKKDFSTIFVSQNINIITFQKQSDSTFNHSVNKSINNFKFPTDNDKTKEFLIKYVSNSNTIQASEINFNNDTIIARQKFDTYYAYDDGIPERAFAMAGSGAKLAYQFELQESDTLTAVLISILEMFNDINNSFRMVVWSDKNNLPDQVLYTGDYYEVPRFIVDADFRVPLTFRRYELDTALVLPEGKYHIGWEQALLDKFYVGFDMNNITNHKLKYNLDGFWQDVTFKGSLLLRPDFGNADLQPIISLNVNEQLSDSEKLSTYPNPSNGWTTFSLKNNHITSIHIYDMVGKMILENHNIHEQYVRIDLSHLQTGIYFVNAYDNNKNQYSQKLIITK
jgi:hypothetical protein